MDSPMECRPHDLFSKEVRGRLDHRVPAGGMPKNGCSQRSRVNHRSGNRSEPESAGRSGHLCREGPHGSEALRRTAQQPLCYVAKYSQIFRTLTTPLRGLSVTAPLRGLSLTAPLWGLSKVVPCARRNDYFEHRLASSWRSSSSGIPCPASSWAIPSSMARRVGASSAAINSGTGWSILNSIIGSIPIIVTAIRPIHSRFLTVSNRVARTLAQRRQHVAPAILSPALLHLKILSALVNCTSDARESACSTESTRHAKAIQPRASRRITLLREGKPAPVLGPPGRPRKRARL
jgi:hypothetical protein